MSQYYTLLTPIGLAKVANAQVTQTTVAITKIAVGDSNGNNYSPTGKETDLKNEKWRGGVTSVSVDLDNPNWVVVEGVLPANVGGFTLREIGLFDSDNDLIAIGNYPETYKPIINDGSTMDLMLRIIIEVNNADSVTLKIDPNVIIASRDYVDKKFKNLDSRIGDTNELETDYKSGTVGAINEVNDVLSKLVENVGFNEPKSAVLEREANTLDASIKTLSSVTAIEGRTIVNLVPLFDSGTWSYDAAATVGIASGRRIVTTNNSAVNQLHGSDKIPLKANTPYTLNYESNQAVGVTEYDAAGNVLTDYSGKITFTPKATAVFARVWAIVAPGATLVLEAVTLNEGSTALPFVANAQGIKNPTIENIRHNMIPAFNLNASDPYTPGWMYLDVIDNNGSGSWTSGKYARVLLQVVPGTKYTFSCTRNAKVKITTNKGTQWDEFQLATLFEESAVQNSNMSCTFKVPAGVNFIRILFENINGGYVSGPMMVKGTVPAPYKAQVREALTLKTALHAGDQLKIDATGRLVTVKQIFETQDLGSYTWEYLNKGTDITYVRMAPPSNPGLPAFKDHKETVVDYQGRVLSRQLPPFDTNIESSWSEATTIVGIVLPNEKTGWGPTYVPTAVEIKAYFMGWAMYRYDVGGTAINYDGVGTKAWVPLYNNRANNEGSGFTLTLPTAPIAVSSKWQPYKLLYELKNPVTEVVDTAGSFTLDEGENKLVVSEGRVVQEITKPFYILQGTYDGVEVANAAMVNSAFHTEVSSKLRYKSGKLVAMYKNGKPFTDYMVQTSSPYAYGVERYIIRNYDPSAVYTVDYIPMYPYQLTAPTNAVTVEYADNVGSALQLLTKKAAGLETRMSNVENGQNFKFGKDEGGVYIIIDEEALT